MEKKPEKHGKQWELRAKLAAMVEYSNDAIIGTDLNGVITSWNKGAEKIYGYTAEKMIGQPVLILLSPGRSDEILRILEKIRHGKVIRDYETVQAGKKGRQVNVSLIVSPMRNSRGEIVGASTIARDITRRKKAEETVRMQAQILDEIHESVITTDIDGYITSWNKGAEKMYLYTSDEVLGRHISIIYPEDERGVLQEEVIAPLKEKGEHETEVRLMRKSGEKFYALLLLALLRDEHGAVTGMLGSSVDITDRKHAEEELRANEEQFRLIYEKSPLGIAFVNAEGFLTACNDKFTEIAGAPRERLIGFNMKTGVRDRKVKSAVEKAFTGQIAVFEGDYVTAVGSNKIVMRTIYSPLQTKSGSFRGIMLLSEDITERRRAEEQLKDTEEKFRLFLEYCPVYVFFKDKDIRSVHLSRNFEKMLGRPLHELLGKTMDELFPSELAKSMIEDDRRILQEGKPLEVEEEFNGRRYSTLKFPIVIEGEPRFLAGFTMDITERKRLEEEREGLIADLQAALTKIKTLSGLLPICMHCKKIRDDKGYWNQLEVFIRNHSEAEFSHGICPDCLRKIYPEYS